MKTLQSIFEQEERALGEGLLSTAREPEQAKQLLDRSLARMLITFNEQCESERLQRTLARQMQLLRAVLPLLLCQGESLVWQRSNQEENFSKEQGRGKHSLLFWILLMAGLGLFGAGLILLMAGAISQKNASGAVLPLLLFAGAGALCFFAGNRWHKSAAGSGKNSYLVQNTLDPDAVLGVLRTALLVMDQQLLDVQKEFAAEAMQQGEEGDESTPLLGPGGLELLCALLEAKMTADGDFALDRLEEINTFLYRQGIEPVLYTGAHEEWFEVMPGKYQKTLRPALLQDGKLLKKGLATGGAV